MPTRPAKAPGAIIAVMTMRGTLTPLATAADSGRSESAAVASGVNVPRMVMTAMIAPGAFAGLVGMPQLFGQDHHYGPPIPAGLGFAGTAEAGGVGKPCDH